MLRCGLPPKHTLRMYTCIQAAGTGVESAGEVIALDLVSTCHIHGQGSESRKQVLYLSVCRVSKSSRDILKSFLHEAGDGRLDWKLNGTRGRASQAARHTISAECMDNPVVHL